MSEYEQFLKAKVASAPAVGFEVSDSDLNPALFPFQRAVVRWALRLGRAALFEDCGLGKTPQQLAWADQVCRHAGGDAAALVLAPLAVAHQTAAEGRKFGVPVTVCREGGDVRPGVNVTNYELLHKFDPSRFAGAALDESSILKSYTGRTKQALCDAFARTPYRLACTATPAPNDHLELGNHSQFLGVMDSNEMISRWFVNDTMHAGRYRLKGHAADDFWAWVASWAVCVTRPSDLGYPDDGFVLPELEILRHVVDVDAVTGAAEGEMFRDGKLTATTLHKEMRLTAPDRAAKAADLVRSSPGEAWVVWCNTNYEAEALVKLIPDAVEVRGSEPDARKEKKLEAFGRGEARVIVTKPKIAGFGLNWQHCRNVAFVGLSYSYEQFYQAVRRVWRFGQTRPVRCHVVTAATEGDVLTAVREKEAENQRMRESMAAAMRKTSLAAAGRRLSLRGDAGGRPLAVPAWLRPCA